MPERAKQHRSRQTPRPRGSAWQRGYNDRWQRFRAAYLMRNPLCVECKRQGRIEPATDVDHKTPVTGPNDPTFFDERAVAALCHSCHAKKTATQDGGFGR